MVKLKLLIAAGLLVAGLPLLASAEPSGQELVDGLIVKFQPLSPRARLRMLSTADAHLLSQAAATPLAASREMSGERHVLRFHHPLSVAEAEAVAQRLSAAGDIAYAVPDRRKFPQRVPNDELYGLQWNYSDPVAGINLPAAWDITTGSAAVTVAIVDTGSRPHPDAGLNLPGYDFISDPYTANDGDGRDADPTDPGDAVTAADAQAHPELTPANDSWHGEFVAGIVGAAGNNGIGMAGVTWNSALLHVRVLGKGGGTDSDILDGINWAAGLPVPGVPPNPHPARIVNLSLGGEGPCGAAYQSTFDALAAAGATIVVSAGNNAADVANTSPANCTGAITVTATSRNGARASYSNTGSVAGAITLAAPGGDGVVTDRIVSLANTGLTAPANEFYAWKQGTSFAAPQVSGVVALMLAVNPGLAPAQVKQILRDTARAFPVGTVDDCTSVRCGAGLLDARAAVQLASALAAPQVIPATGWWSSPSEPGIGFSIEQQGAHLLFAAYLYDDSGHSTWLASGPATKNGTAYLGILSRYAGGQTLTGAYRPAFITGNAGDIAVQFSSPSAGKLTWPGGSINIQRYDFGPGGATASQPAASPEAGWWWAPGEGGRGYAIEIQGNALFIAGYMYDAAGNPVWYSSGPAPMSNTSTYLGQWQQFGNGPTLAAASRTPQLVNANAGALSLQFSSTSAATLTLPDGRQVAIERYRF